MSEVWWLVIIVVCGIAAVVLGSLFIYGLWWIRALVALILFEKPSKEVLEKVKEWYGSAWMSCVYCSCYQIHNNGPYKQWWWAFLMAKLDAQTLKWHWQENDSGVYYRIAEKPLLRHGILG